MAHTFELIDRKRLIMGHYASGDTVSSDGRIFIGGGGNDGSFGLYTCDGGKSFEVVKGLYSIDHMTPLGDGSYFAPGFGSVAVRQFDPRVQEKVPYVLKKRFARSFDDILKGNIQTEFEVVDIPDLAVGYGDSGDSTSWHTGSPGSGYIRLDNGDILIAMYGQFKADRTRLPYFEKYDFYQYRSWVLVSHDGGRSFSYLSTVAATGEHPINPEAEGYCEPDLLDLGGGHVLCALRTQGHEVYSEMYACHSYDYGRTWSAPEVMSPYGVLPRLCRLTDGTILCASGKWDIFIVQSNDDGKTWSEPFIVTENKGRWDRGPSGYNTIVETAPGEILLVYDTTDDPVSDDIKPGERRFVYADRYKVSAF